MKKYKIAIIAAIILILIFRFCFGIFVIQPIGAVPEGATIVYFRLGLNLPFIESVDGLLGETEMGVSLLGRAMGLAAVAEPIMKRKVINLPYSETLYLWSTDGMVYEK